MSDTVDGFREKYALKQSRLLGSGASGQVCTVRRRGTEDEYAMKIIDVENDRHRLQLRNELHTHKMLDHPNICRIVESFEDNKRIYIIMELCTGGSIVDKMEQRPGGMDEASAATLVEKICSAVLYCHQHGIVHRDIKLDNIMYEDGRMDAEPKLIDFGFAIAVHPGKETMTSKLGTPSYMAPELTYEDQPLTYDSSVDMWALGAVTYMLLSGEKPFNHPNRKEKQRMVREDPLQFPARKWHNVSPEAKSFCMKLMQKQPKHRMCASQAISHPWIRQHSRRHSDPEHAAWALQSNESIVRSLEAYAESEKLRQLALELIAFTTPPKRVEDLRRVFQSIDTDDSGTIDLQEFKDAMKPALPIPTRMKSEHIERIFDHVDLGNTGEIDYTEFLAATLSSHGPEELRTSVGTAFNMLDTTADGYITRDDLETALTGKLSQSDLDSMMTRADAKGRVSSSAFQDVVLGPCTDVRRENSPSA